MVNERTPLTNESGPSYIFPSRPTRLRDRQLKQFQCCICCSLLTAIVLALVITVTYRINVDDDQNTIQPIDTSSTPASPEQMDDVISLLVSLDWPLNDESAPVWQLAEPNETEQKAALAVGKQALGDREILEESMDSPAYNTPSFRAQRAVGTTEEARRIAKIGYVENHATKWLARDHKKPYSDRRWSVGNGPSIGSLTRWKPDVKCDFNAKYRTANGTCNSKYHPSEFGVAMRPFRRVLNPDYADGISIPRKSYDGSELPSARQVSLEVHRPSYHSDYNFTVMLAVWGQFLDHDITSTALNQGENGQPIECCNTKVMHPECFPVPIEKGDPYFDDYNVTCLNFVRSIPSPTGQFGPRQQLNQATAFIDGSVVYGNTDEVIDSLREKQGGRLLMFTTPDNRTLLPHSRDPTDGCNEKDMNAQGKYCFATGDKRANENLLLTSMHLIFARHHNYLATNLERINPHWSDDDIFFEARRILGAQMQHIHYNEFLSVLLGKEMSEKLDILSHPNGTRDMYDPTVDPSIANSFAAAAFRFAHTLLPGLMRMTRDTTSPEAVRLHAMLFNPFSLYKGHGLNNAIKMAVYTPLQKNDPLFTTELTENLFIRDENVTLDDIVPEPIPVIPPEINMERPPPICGLDLVSLNIQRGRDHGLPTYVEWRQHCKFSKIGSGDWAAFQKVVDPDSFTRIKSMYKQPEDVDLYTGALSEYPLKGAIVGPLLACIIGDQFLRLKVGDSFWYERPRGSQKFTNDQLEQIYNTTLSSIICTNSDEVDKIPVQKYIMKHSGVDNPIEECGSLTSFDFTPWTDDHNKRKWLHASKIRSEEMHIKTMERTQLQINDTLLPLV